MGRGRSGVGDDEKEPAIEKPAPKGDQITAVIGEVGRWQLEKILIVFIAAAPGLAHIFHAGFITPKQRFWCKQAMDEAGLDIPPPWTVDYPDTNTSYNVFPGPEGMTTDKKLLGVHHDH